MGCDREKCKNCGCDPEVEPTPEPEKEIVYVEKDDAGFWNYIWGFGLGWLFFGC